MQGKWGALYLRKVQIYHIIYYTKSKDFVINKLYLDFQFLRSFYIKDS